METNIQTLENCKTVLTLKADKEEWKSKIEKAYNKLGGTPIVWNDYKNVKINFATKNKSIEDYFYLSFDEKINVDIVYRKEQEQVIFAAPIGDIPAEGQEGFFKQLLIANAFGIENAGATLGIEEDANRIVLSYMFISSTFSFVSFDF